MKWKMLALLFALTALLLSGCMFPKEELAQNQVPYKDQIQAVQQAVNDFKKDKGGILPIKTKEADTPIYQKYPIDFKKITPQYMAEPPGNAFESGGIFQYVLVDAETNPTVKLLDLRTAEAIRDINLRIKTKGYPPFGKEISKNVYSIDFKKLGYQEPPYAISPFTNKNLTFVVTSKAEVFVDYRPDLFEVLKNTKREIKPGEDIRSILVDNSMFVPAYSLPYTIDPKTNEPIFLQK
ncbi:hypothetical protein [Neobacillus mesonae]|uniref:hypothetical protein n=1 Tax=Neobacillus mesonae TaxID=1193713 RepID=UPI0020426A3C|nr:hypothetical protein [Neobacillus mesonae]MCM3566779.1 hypothetical protein [Neobacillus mesonae]